MELYIHRFFSVKTYNKYPEGECITEEIVTPKTWTAYQYSERDELILISTETIMVREKDLKL